jgi:hypothetical protein
MFHSNHGNEMHWDHNGKGYTAMLTEHTYTRVWYDAVSYSSL